VASSGYGYLDFYDTEDKRVFRNVFDSFWSQKVRTGAIKLKSDYPQLPYDIVLYDGKNAPLINVERVKEVVAWYLPIFTRTSLVFKDSNTHQLLGVANLEEEGHRIRWKITLLDVDSLPDREFMAASLAFITLKYSQAHHFPSSNDLAYVTGIPQKQSL